LSLESSSLAPSSSQQQIKTNRRNNAVIMR